MEVTVQKQPPNVLTHCSDASKQQRRNAAEKKRVMSKLPELFLRLGLCVEQQARLEYRMYIPDSSLRTHRLLIEAHDVPVAGHLGRDKTVKRLHYWPGMEKSVRQSALSA
jgi:Integrase zinc binding domain